MRKKTKGNTPMNKKIVLDSKNESVIFLCRKDKRLAKLINTIGPLTYTPHTNPYKFLVHEIIEQMLSVKAGAKIFERVNNLCSGEITLQAIVNLTDDQLRLTGMSRNKVGYIRALNQSLLSKELVFDDLVCLSDDQVVKKLTAIKGIGTWTAKMFLIFVLNRNDILPFEDTAFLQAYRWLYKTNDLNKASIMNKCKKWKPYSSIASRFLYRALDSGLTKQEFHLFKEDNANGTN